MRIPAKERLAGKTLNKKSSDLQAFFHVKMARVKE